MLIIAHSDDFRWFGPSDKLDEWDLVIATFNAHNYGVTDATLTSLLVLVSSVMKMTHIIWINIE